MLEAHAAPDTQDLYTISANGFSATADAFARDPDSEGLWFLSMVGAQSALKAIWAALLKHPPETAHLLVGTDGTVLSGGFHRCEVPYETLGTWTTKICPPARFGGGWHALVYTRMAEYAFERDAFLLARPWRGRGARPAPPLPRPSQPAAPAPQLGGLAVASGTGGGRDRAAAVGGHRRLPLHPGRRGAARGPLARRGGRDAHAAA